MNSKLATLTGLTNIRVYKGFREEYKTYCSLECASAINSYLDFRRRYGEQITSESYLIRRQFNRRDGGRGTMKVSDANDIIIYVCQVKSSQVKNTACAFQ